MGLLWKTVWYSLRKLTIELPYDPAVLLWVIYPEVESRDMKRYVCTPVLCSIIHKCQKGGGSRHTHQWRDAVYAHSAILLSLKKEGNSATRYSTDES